MKNMTFLDSVKKMPLMPLPVRTPVIQLKNARVMISPGSMLTAEQFKSAGAVTDIVGPSLLHLAGVPAAAAAFPQARIWGVPGSKEHKPQIKWHQMITESTWPFMDELPFLQIQGMPKMREVIFLHKESKTLIVTDLFFNMTDAKGLGARLILSMFGTYRKFALSKLFLKYAEDKEAFQKSLQPILNWDFENIVVSHGYSIEGHGKQMARQAMAERQLI